MAQGYRKLAGSHTQERAAPLFRDGENNCSINIYFPTTCKSEEDRTWSPLKLHLQVSLPQVALPGMGMPEESPTSNSFLLQAGKVTIYREGRV